MYFYEMSQKCVFELRMFFVAVVYDQDENLPPSLGILCSNLKHTRDVIIEIY